MDAAQCWWTGGLCFPVWPWESLWKGTKSPRSKGMAEGNKLHPLQAAFADLGAAQCGYCTPGMLLTAKALLEQVPRPSRDQIKAALAGNICRCTGYIKIFEAVELAAAWMAGEQAEAAKESVYGWQ